MVASTQTLQPRALQTLSQLRVADKKATGAKTWAWTKLLLHVQLVATSSAGRSPETQMLAAVDVT